jgi:hypothetical protein
MEFGKMDIRPGLSPGKPWVAAMCLDCFGLRMGVSLASRTCTGTTTVTASDAYCYTMAKVLVSSSGVSPLMWRRHLASSFARHPHSEDCRGLLLTVD